MRLLLDEMYDRHIAEQLPGRGHDVIAVTERPDLRNLEDEALLRQMAFERRAILTENAAHFMPHLDGLLAEGEESYGVLFTSPRSMPRSKRTVGLYVRSLDRYLRAHATDDALKDSVDWLEPAPRRR